MLWRDCWKKKVRTICVSRLCVFVEKTCLCGLPPDVQRWLCLSELALNKITAKGYALSHCANEAEPQRGV
jgi:hypothetical protein